VGGREGYTQDQLERADCQIDSEIIKQAHCMGMTIATSATGQRDEDDRKGRCKIWESGKDIGNNFEIKS
jgi:hypothetical protein